MQADLITVRHAQAGDADRWLALYEAVASEGTWIGGEAPVERERLRKGFALRYVGAPERAVMLLAEADGDQIGHLGLTSERGVGDLGMAVADGWRGRGVGSALMAAAVDWAQQTGLHKLALQVWPHNAAARALYRKFGFAEEGRLRRHYRRRNGQLWDAIVMGLVLDTKSPGSPLDEPPLQYSSGSR